MIYSLLRDQEMVGFQFGLTTESEEPVTRSMLIKGLDDTLVGLGEKIAAEPWASPMPDIASRYFADAPGRPLEAVQTRSRRPGKPDPATWGWTPSGDGLTPPGIEP